MDDEPRNPTLIAAFAAVLVVAASAIFLIHGRTGGSADAANGSGATSASGGASGSGASSPAVPSTTPVSTTPAPTPVSNSAMASAATGGPAAASAAAGARIERIEAGRRSRSISIAALNMDTGAQYSSGSTGGMRSGSIVKLWILETLFMQKQAADSSLSASERATATRMIENSDNDAADTLYQEVGRQAGLRQYERRLGMENTTVDPDGHWGLTTTCATDYIALLKNLVVTGGPLSTGSRKYILGLMREVEADQRWGVGVAADKGTEFANKNGWLNVDDDDGLWLVNSTGVLTVHGQLVLMVVQTQHNWNFQAGIALVQKLAKAMVPIVTPASK